MPNNHAFSRILCILRFFKFSKFAGMNNFPIGVFDSGMGGLTVWRELRKALPNESIIYYGDGLHCPYGDKPADLVLKYIDEAARTLLAMRAKLIVLACNTATMTGIKYLRNAYDIPFVGMEPAIKPAAETTLSGVVGVLATRGSLESAWFGSSRARYTGKARIVTSVGEGFVEAVEAGEELSPRTMALVRKALAPLLEAGADRIVLGCTHYPFLTDVIRQAASDSRIEIIDPAPAVARRAKYLLERYSLTASPDHTPHYEFISAAGPVYAEKLRLKSGLL